MTSYARQSIGDETILAVFSDHAHRDAFLRDGKRRHRRGEAPRPHRVNALDAADLIARPRVDQRVRVVLADPEDA